MASKRVRVISYDEKGEQPREVEVDCEEQETIADVFSRAFPDAGNGDNAQTAVYAEIDYDALVPIETLVDAGGFAVGYDDRVRHFSIRSTMENSMIRLLVAPYLLVSAAHKGKPINVQVGGEIIASYKVKKRRCKK